MYGTHKGLSSTKVKILRVFSDLKREFLKKVRRSIKNDFCKGIIKVNNYAQYEEYVNNQKEKTRDPERIKKWIGSEWNAKVDSFKEIFMRNKVFVENKKNAICLGSRTGQEVKALIDIGIHAIGIDLVPFLPYTIEGDIHNIKYPNNTFDLVFTNIFDHALYPIKVCNEIERITQPKGIIIMHLFIGDDFDKYTETRVNHPSSVTDLFKNVNIIHSREIKNTADSLNWELVLQKKNT